MHKGEAADANAQRIVTVDWNSVEIHDRTNLVIAPIDDIEMAKLFGIPIDDRDKEKKRDEAANDGDNHLRDEEADIDLELLENAAVHVDDAHDDELVTVYDKEDPVIEVGRLFPSMDEFRMCFRTYAVKREFATKTMWTDKKKFYAKCIGYDGGAKPCKWYISARRQPDGRTIRVNQIPKPHTCITSSQTVTKMTSQLWVAEKIKPILATTPNNTAKRLKIDLEKQYPIKLNYTTVWKAKQRAMKELYGDWANTFRMLYNFKAEVEKRSPGSVVEIDTEVTADGKVFFSKFFMALKPCIDGFKAGCRPYLSIDSSFLTRKWNGQLAACNALDGHNWMFPVAIGMFQSETEASWTWFMMQLKRCIGPVSPLAVHTDACKGLENAVKIVFPHAEQRECFGHMWMNLIKKFRGDDFGRMWPAARSYTRQTHSYHLEKIKAACSEEDRVKFCTWLETYHSLLWYRSGFNTAIKCDHINNNLAESFNNKGKELKDLPVHDMVDQIRIMIMRLWELRRRLGDVLQGDKLPDVVQQVVNRSRNLAHLRVEKSSLWGAEVRDTKTGRRHVVDTQLHECTCLEWQHTGKPCEHAILFLASKHKLNMHPYLHEYYSVAKFKAAYGTPIPALTDQSQWPEVDIQFSLCPPLMKRKAGRPKQSRFKAWFEKGGSSKKGKKDEKKDAKPKRAQKGNKNRCKLCEELGHRAGSTKCRYTAEKPKYVHPKSIPFLVDDFSPPANLLVFRRKRGEKGPPLVVDECWPVKRARINGQRKKRTNQIMFGAAEVQSELVLEDDVQTVEALGHTVSDLEALVQNEGQNEPVVEALVQNEPVVEALVQNEPVVEALVQTDQVVEALVQSDHVVEALVQSDHVDEALDHDHEVVEEVQEVKETLGRAVGRPDDNGKKKKSINLLCGVKLVKEKKTRGKKSQKK